MNSRRTLLLTVLWIALIALLPSAHADGPLIVDPATKTGYHFSNEPIPVYFDLGNLGVTYDYSTGVPVPVTFDNSVGEHLVRKGYGDWSSVPTTSVRATVLGNFSLKGLPDIDATNVSMVIGSSNGRGIYVIFDTDGTILQDYLGAPDGVLGVSSPQYSIAGTSIITESWTVLNGAVIDPADTGAAYFQGVATHEFGHSLGLAHTQTNGAAVFYGDKAGPDSCSALPYALGPTRSDIETMYPYIDPTAGTGTGAAQGSIHTLDSIAAISDLYPGRGWPESFGSISGKVYDLDGRTELTGVNVIARNLADPYAGGNSALTGQLTQGLLGPDGSFVINGLIPGQRYVLYVDAVLAGGFPTPPQWFLPGAEKFYRAEYESGAAYDPCAYTVITAHAGVTTHANIRFDHLPGAPMLYQLGYGVGVTGLSGDGKVAVGNSGRGGPAFQWTAATGVVPMDPPTTGETVSISPNGKYISTDLLDAASDNSLGAYRWDAANGWLATQHTGSCGGESTVSFSLDDLGTVYGLSYNSCADYKAWKWSPRYGSRILASPGVQPDGTPMNTRVNRSSSGGETQVGWTEDPLTGLWQGTVWNEGEPSIVRLPDGEAVDEVTALSGDGNWIGGALLVGQLPFGDGYKRRARGGKLEYVAPLPGDAAPAQPFVMSRSGDVMAGFSGNPFLSFNPGPFIWTREMGTVNLDEFLHGQGTAMEQWASLWETTAISDDGRTLGGFGLGFQYYAGWVLRIDHAFVCHQDGGSTYGGRAQSRTLSVPFPDEFNEHLRHGDVVGRCT